MCFLFVQQVGKSCKAPAGPVITNTLLNAGVDYFMEAMEAYWLLHNPIHSITTSLIIMKPGDNYECITICRVRGLDCLRSNTFALSGGGH